jgi:hypothetical protein
MKVGGYYQCCSCGAVHYIKYPYKTEELYYEMFCEECEDKTSQLWIGDNLDDKYLYWDINNDPRYFLY